MSTCRELVEFLFDIKWGGMSRVWDKTLSRLVLVANHIRNRVPKPLRRVPTRATRADQWIWGPMGPWRIRACNLWPETFRYDGQELINNFMRAGKIYNT